MSATRPRPSLTVRAREAREYAAIHEAACRYRRQRLVCSACRDLAERADRLTRAARGQSHLTAVEA